MTYVYIVKQRETNFDWDEPAITTLFVTSDRDTAIDVIAELERFWEEHKHNKFDTYYTFWVEREIVHTAEELKAASLVAELKEEWEDIL